MKKHKCIKCGIIYEDKEEEDYYCSNCLTLRKKIAKEIDEKFAKMPKKVIKSDLQLYDEARGKNAFVYISKFY